MSDFPLAKSINFTPTMIKKLKRDYAVAVADKKESFELLPGRQIFTAYAGHLIEFVENMLNK